MVRHLLVFPIYHTTRELGSFGERSPLNPQMEEAIQRYWVRVNELVKSLPVDFSQVTVYQDSLPNHPNIDIDAWVTDGPDTPNNNLLRFLRDHGAKVIGTENVEFMFNQETFIRKIYSETPESERRDKYLEGHQQFLDSRDKYIAERIDQTLSETGLGVLFIGAGHNVRRFLPKDIMTTTTRDPESNLRNFFSEVSEKNRLNSSKEGE